MAAPYREDDSSVFYRDYYNNQSGGGMPVFAGRPIMGGDGIGNVLSGLFRAVAPVLKRGAVNLGKRALTAGANVANDVIQGKNVKSSLKRRFANTGKDILSDVVGSLRPDSLKTSRAPPAKKRRKTSRKPSRRAGIQTII